MVFGKALRNIKPGRYRIQTEVVYDVIKREQHTETVVVSPAVPDKTVTRLGPPRSVR